MGSTVGSPSCEDFYDNGNDNSGSPLVIVIFRISITKFILILIRITAFLY